MGWFDWIWVNGFDDVWGLRASMVLAGLVVSAGILKVLSNWLKG